MSIRILIFNSKAKRYDERHNSFLSVWNKLQSLIKINYIKVILLHFMWFFICFFSLYSIKINRSLRKFTSALTIFITEYYNTHTNDEVIEFTTHSRMTWVDLHWHNGFILKLKDFWPNNLNPTRSSWPPTIATMELHIIEKPCVRTHARAHIYVFNVLKKQNS